MNLKRSSGSSGTSNTSAEERAKRFRDEGFSIKSRLGPPPAKPSSTHQRLGPHPKDDTPPVVAPRTAVTWFESSVKTVSSRIEKPRPKIEVDLRSEKVLSTRTPTVNREENTHEPRRSSTTRSADLKIRNSLTDIDTFHKNDIPVALTGKLETSLHGIDINTRLTMGLIDTHMHIDFTLNSHDSHESTWKDFCKRYSARFPSCYEGGIAAFCQPSSFSCASAMLNEAFQDERVWMTFGVHPHFSDRYSEDSLRACLHKFKTKVVALGEIGLDTSKKNHVSLEVQKEVFRSQAEIGIECKLPLVIHTRVNDNNEETLMFMRKFVPRDHKIHRHCFTGTWDEANDWISHFRNCYIGFTALLNTQPELMKVAARIPFDRILLETDSPYFRNGIPHIQDGNRPVATMPGDVIYTAVGIAKARGIPLEAVICQTRLNAKNVFGI